MYLVAYQFEDPLSLVISMLKLVQIILRVKPLGGVGFNNYNSQLNCKKKEEEEEETKRKKTFDVGNVFRKIGILLC
jgi:hypothetical protein